MLVHSVFFWLKSDRSQEQVEEFRAGLESLGGIETAKAVYIGSPAPTTPRPVVDNSYTMSVTVLFDDMAGHDAYQSHALHTDFLKQFSGYWDRVLIYDAC